MTQAVLILRWILRLTFLAALIFGLVLWTGHGYRYLSTHMWLGFIITFDLLILVVLGFLARVKPVLPLIAVVWAILLPFIGIAQLRVLPGANHWFIQVLHLILGLGAVGLGEVLGARAARARVNRS